MDRQKFCAYFAVKQALTKNSNSLSNPKIDLVSFTESTLYFKCDVTWGTRCQLHKFLFFPHAKSLVKQFCSVKLILKSNITLYY